MAEKLMLEHRGAYPNYMYHFKPAHRQSTFPATKISDRISLKFQNKIPRKKDSHPSVVSVDILVQQLEI